MKYWFVVYLWERTVHVINSRRLDIGQLLAVRHDRNNGVHITTVVDSI